MKTLEKICWWIIAVGAGLVLLTPLLLDNRFMFPFITTKVLWFRILVEIMAVAYLLLVVANRDYRPRFGVVGVLLSLFIASATLSSLLGPNPYVSFWGNIERAEGLLLWLHLWLYFVILTAVFRSHKHWLVFFEIFLGVSLFIAIFGIGQQFELWFLLRTSGSRIDATFGNAAFFAGYMLFAVAIAAFLFFARRSVLARLYYLAVSLLAVWAIFASGTRGAVFGLVAGVMAVALLLAWTFRGNRMVRTGSIAIIALIVLAIGIVFIGQDQGWVKESRLRRFISFSREDKTTRNRLAIWNAAWQGWKERPILGYGLEHFGTVSNRFFPPEVYDNQGSQVWFDRAHNLIFDRGLTTGLVGLLLYLGFIFYPAAVALSRLRDPESRRGAMIFIALVVAFFIQDLFVFETVTLYVVLCFIWAFMAATGLGERRSWQVPAFRRPVWTGLAIVALLALMPVLWIVNIKTGQVNRAAAIALGSNLEEEDFFVVMDRYRRTLEGGTYGQQEYRVQYIDTLGQFLAKIGPIKVEQRPPVREVVAYADQIVERQLAEFGHDTRNHLVAMRHYNYTNNSFPDERVARLEKALTFFDKLRVSSPTRPHVYQEAGYSHLYLYRTHRDRGEREQATRHAAEAERLFEQAVALNPRVVESYINLMMLYLNVEEPKKIYPIVERMKAAGAPYRRTDYLPQLVQLAKNNESDEWVINFTQEILDEEPSNLQALVTQARAYSNHGNRAKAIELLKLAKHLYPSTDAQMDELIRKIQSGELERERSAAKK